MMLTKYYEHNDSRRIIHVLTPITFVELTYARF